MVAPHPDARCSRTACIDEPVTRAGVPIDFAAGRAVAQRDAEAGIVLLKNDGKLLPIAATARRIAVIGGHADKGVISGGGSSQVYPEGENAVPGLEPEGLARSGGVLPLVSGRGAAQAAAAGEGSSMPTAAIRAAAAALAEGRRPGDRVRHPMGRREHRRRRCASTASRTR